MSLILSLETSTNVCSVAIHDQGKLLASGEVHIEQSHASKLAVLIEEVSKLSSISLNQLKAVAISSGPGSYTGLRIGTSTAKGLCYALDIPLLAVNTLDLLAHQVNNLNLEKSWLCPMIDARRMEVYCQIVDDKLGIKEPVQPKIIDETSFSEILKQKKVIFFGNGADKCEGVIKHTNAFFLKNVFPSAAQLGIVAFQKFNRQKYEDVVHFEPIYLKEFLVKKAAV